MSPSRQADLEFPWGDTFASTPRCPAAPSALGDLKPGEAAHVGVLFVHGLGFQLRGDIFRDSVAPLLRFLREAAFERPEPLEDPTRVAAESLPGTDLPFVELDVPRSGTTGREHWVITEAWWAASFSPPSLRKVVSWLGAQGNTAVVAQRLQAQRPRTHPGPFPRRSGVVSEPAQLVISVASSLMLAVYAILRAVFAVLPIAAVREVAIGPIDRFLREWAGDMRVLLRDEAQAGMVRFRIARSIRALQAYGCDSIVVVAHSGGAVASYMTLTDERYVGLPIKSLVTYGSGLNITWRLLGLTDDMDPDVARVIGGGLARDLPTGLKWYDFWATDDPVPAGPVNEPPTSVSVLPIRDTQPPRERGHRVNNRWGLRADHGAYFDNDEEFLAPLVEAIDDQVRPPDAAGVLAHWSPSERVAARARRLERVGALSMWRRFAAVSAFFAIFGAITTGLVRYWLGLGPGLSRPLGDVTNYLEGVVARLLGAAPTGATKFGIGKPIEFDLAAALSLTGNIAWLAILAAVAYLLRPELVDWRQAWNANGWMRAVTLVLAGFIVVVLLLAGVVGIPGYLGVSIASTPNLEFFEAVWNMFRPGRGDEFGRVFNPALMNFIIAAAFVLIVIAARAAAIPAVSYLRRKHAVLAIVTSVAIGAAIGWIAVSLVASVVLSGGFRANLTGWLLLLLIFSALSSIGQWRWNQWDEQERWEFRGDVAGVNRRRRAARAFDAIVFATLTCGVLLASVGFALRPLWIDVANTLLMCSAASVVLAVLTGLGQDEFNGRLDIRGTAPTAVSQI